MDFWNLRARRSLVATSALALMIGCAVGAPVAFAQAAPQGGAAPGGATQGGAAQGGAAATGQPAQKNYKDRGEYDLYSQATQQAKDPKAQLQTLQTWQDKYPQTDFEKERLLLFINALRQLAPNDPAARQQLLDKCNQLLKLDPKNFQAAYFITFWGPRMGGTASADLLSQVDSAAHIALDNVPQKPASMSDADWAKAKGAIEAVPHNALAWEATQKKDTATAENEYKASLTADPSQGGISAVYAKMLYDDKKYPEALFEYARAANYDGPNSLPAADRQKLSDFLKTAYTGYHGSADGLDQLVAQAKTAALPPDGLAIASAQDLANNQANALNQRISSDKAFAIWYAIKQNLQDKGDAFFDSDVKDTEIPGGANGVNTFSGTVISLDPADAPKTVVLGVEDPTKPDATLVFSTPLTPEALNTIKVGQKIDFSGVADSYTKDPYMLTFKDPTIPGVKTTTPPRQAHKRRR